MDFAAQLKLFNTRHYGAFLSRGAKHVRSSKRWLNYRAKFRFISPIKAPAIGVGKMMFRTLLKSTGAAIAVIAFGTSAANAQTCEIAELTSAVGESYLQAQNLLFVDCLLYTSPSPRDQRGSRMPSSA